MTNKDIHKYLMGEMDQQSKNEFERKLEEDDKLRNEYELHKEIKDAVQEDEVMELRDQLEELGHSVKTERKFNLKRSDLFAIAASFTLFIGIGLLMLFHNQLTHPDDLYASYFETYPSIYSQRSVGGDSPLGIIKEKAFLAYEKENWDESRSYFRQLFEKNPEKVEYPFYLGVINLKLDNPDDAIEQFQTILENKNPLFEDQAIWYMALGYLKKNNIERSVHYLNRIISEDMANKEKASELINKLE
jgi:tetratricopeptide (TPR) repeat protein